MSAEEKEANAVARAKRALEDAEGVLFSEGEEWPNAADVVGQDEIWVGRLRPDRSIPHGFNLWVAADNLRKGAATNAVQIAEELIRRNLLSVTLPAEH